MTLWSNKVSAALFANFSTSFGFLSKYTHDSLLFFFKTMRDSSNLLRFQEVVDGALWICNVISEKDAFLLLCSSISICREVFILKYPSIRDSSTGVKNG